MDVDETQECPNCNQTIEEGYLSTIQSVVAKLGLLNVSIGVRILYSSRCGFLKLVPQL